MPLVSAVGCHTVVEHLRPIANLESLGIAEELGQADLFPFDKQNFVKILSQKIG